MAFKIIFLDIDGVLNNDIEDDGSMNQLTLEQCNDYYRLHGTYDTVSPRCMTLLNELCESTGAMVVVTSTIRKNKTLQEMQCTMDSFGFTGTIIGMTDDLRDTGIVRGNEIYKWILDNKSIIGCSREDDFDEYVILDDDTDMLLFQKDNFIHIDNFVGLTYNNVAKAIWMLEHGRK